VVEGVHEFRPAVLANSDTRLRAFDPPAADALPCCHALGHRIPSLFKEYGHCFIDRDLRCPFLNLRAIVLRRIAVRTAASSTCTGA
jgi:hypothetical protein